MLVILSFLLNLSFLDVSYADPDDETGTTYIDGKLVYNGQSDAIPSIQKDLFMGVFHKKVTTGSLLPFDGEEEKKRQKINFEVLTDNADKTYSLYDRFGGNITYPLYIGEETVYTGFVDKLYKYITLRPDDQEGFFGVISKIQSIGELLLKEDTIYNNEFYTSRPPLKAAGEDPRVNRYRSLTNFTSSEDFSLGLSNYLLDNAKTVT